MMMMGGSGGSMGMNMGMDNMGMSMGSGSMNASAGMTGNMGYMGNMPMYGQGSMNMQNYGAMPGMTDPNAMAHGASHGATNGLLGLGGLDFNSLLNGLLTLAIDIFAILLLVGLVAGAAVLIKRYVFEGELFTARAKAACTRCGQALNAEWACCPKCGETKVTAQTAATTAPQTA